MGDIKDLYDLMEKFVLSVKDRKILERFAPIQDKIDSAMKENITLQSENLDIKRQHAEEIDNLKSTHSKEMDELKLQHEAAMSDINTLHDEKVSELADKIERLNSKIERINRSRKETPNLKGIV